MRKHAITRLTLVGGFCLLVGCSATQLQPGAVIVQVSPDKPNKTCRFVGTVTASQGNFFTGAWTSNANLQEGAFNELQNKAAALGGNYVQIISNQAGVTGSGGGSSRQTNYTTSGGIYSCPHLQSL